MSDFLPYNFSLQQPLTPSSTKRLEMDFFPAGFQIMQEFVFGLRTLCGHILKVDKIMLRFYCNCIISKVDTYS